MKKTYKYHDWAFALIRYHPCYEGLKWAARFPTLQEAWNKCRTKNQLQFMFWYLHQSMEYYGYDFNTGYDDTCFLQYIGFFNNSYRGIHDQEIKTPAQMRILFPNPPDLPDAPLIVTLSCNRIGFEDKNVKNILDYLDTMKDSGSNYYWYLSGVVLK